MCNTSSHILHAWSMESWEILIYIYIYVCALFPLNKTKRGLGPSQYDCCPNFHLYASIETRSSETCLLRKGASVASVMYPSLGIFFRDTLVASHMRHCHFFTKQVQTTGLLPSFDNIDPQSLYRMYRFVFFEFFMFMKDWFSVWCIHDLIKTPLSPLKHASLPGAGGWSIPFDSIVACPPVNISKTIHR